MSRIVQLTDCHLFADPATELRGIATWPRFRSVLQSVRERIVDFDLLVLTGDTSHDEKPATYQAVRDALGSTTSRVRIIPGNHDDRGLLRRVFPECCGGGDDDRITFVIRLGDWQVIGLDTQLPGETSGLLGERQLAWLEQQLESTPDVSTALFMHHPPVKVESPWLDAIGLRDATQLNELLRGFPHVRLIACGHVHQELSASVAGATLYTTPAAGPPFRPRTVQLEIDQQPPGYRLLELETGGRWFTQVLRS